MIIFLYQHLALKSPLKFCLGFKENINSIWKSIKTWLMSIFQAKLKEEYTHFSG
jgi:hypothetical protein